MSIIHQIYCTNCTHGSSALERRLSSDPDSGELAQRVFGYSARAASVEGDQLRQYYQRIEPYLYYFLPHDTPDDRKLDLTAKSAPRRMFYVPSAGGLQVAGQVTYRPTDCEGRPGAYFAHVLLQEEDGAEPRWTALDWLRLWGAPGWVQEDSADVPFLLPTLASPSDLLGQAAPLIDDRALLSFLRDAFDPAVGDSAGETSAPLDILPERWKTMEPQRRSRWLCQALSSYLEAAAADPRQPVWLVVEPAVAALWAYAVARLLPEGPLRNEVGFSTFETDPQRARGPLSATWFHDPQAAAAAPESVRLPGLVVNTLQEASPEKTHPVRKYAAAILQELIALGCEAVDRDLAFFASAHVARPGQLESLAAADEIVSTLLETGTLLDDQWRSSPQATQCVRLRLGQRLSAMADLDAGLKTTVDGPVYLTIVDLLTAKPPLHDARRALVHLLKEIPSERILGLLRLSGVPDEDKITVLLRHVHARGALPVGCEFMWEEFASLREGHRRAGAVLMARVLNRLPSKDLNRLFQSAPKPALPGVILHLMRMFNNKKVKVASLSAAVLAMDEEAVFTLLRTSGEEVLGAYPKHEPAMDQKLAELLRSLPKHPDQFTERLKLILAGQHLLTEDQYLRAAAAWDTCRRQIQEVARLQKPDPGMAPPMRVKLLDSACRDLAKAADQAMSDDVLDGEYTWTQKRDTLLRISQEVLSGLPLFLPGPWEHEELLKRIGQQFQQHRWPLEPLKKEMPAKKEGPRRLVGPEERSLAKTSRWTIVWIGLVLVAFTAGSIWLVYTLFFSSGGGGSPKGRPTRTQRDGGRKMKPVPPGAAKEQSTWVPCPRLPWAWASVHVAANATSWPPPAPRDRPLVAQSAQSNLTAAILRGIRPCEPPCDLARWISAPWPS
jgi:hypothetical protein